MIFICSVYELKREYFFGIKTTEMQYVFPLRMLSSPFSRSSSVFKLCFTWIACVWHLTCSTLFLYLSHFPWFPAELWELFGREGSSEWEYLVVFVILVPVWNWPLGCWFHGYLYTALGFALKQKRAFVWLETSIFVHFPLAEFSVSRFRFTLLTHKTHVGKVPGRV